MTLQVFSFVLAEAFISLIISSSGRKEEGGIDFRMETSLSNKELHILLAVHSFNLSRTKIYLTVTVLCIKRNSIAVPV